MTRSYVRLAAGLLALGLTLVFVARRPHDPPARSPVPAAATVEAVRVTVGPDGVDPSSVVVPVNARVRLRVVNGAGRVARFALAGYEDRLPAASLAPRDSVEREFLADRPGEDFPWLVDGQPRGRLIVSGSHLVEGHR